jgi:hypothetical protein
MLIDSLRPMCRVIADLDLTEPEAAEAALQKAFPDLSSVRALLLAATDLTPKQASPDVRFGRLAKPSPDTFGVSIDAVDMSGAAAEHIHPRGEVSLCFSTEGEAQFMGRPDGWVVAPPGSRHVPTVTNGRMRIVYFLPGGEMTWV